MRASAPRVHSRRVLRARISAELSRPIASYRIVSCIARSCFSYLAVPSISIFIDRHRHVPRRQSNHRYTRQRYRTFLILSSPRSTKENRRFDRVRRSVGATRVDPLFLPFLPQTLSSPAPETKTAATQLCFACAVFFNETSEARVRRRAAVSRQLVQHLARVPPPSHSHSSRDIHSDPGNSSISFIPSVTTALSRAFVSTEQPPATPLYLLLRARPFGSAIPPSPPRSTPPLSLASAAYRRSPASSPPPRPPPRTLTASQQQVLCYRVASDTTQQVALPPPLLPTTFSPASLSHPRTAPFLCPSPSVCCSVTRPPREAWLARRAKHDIAY